MPYLGRTHDDRALLNQECIDKWGQKTGLLADRRPMLTDARRGDVASLAAQYEETRKATCSGADKELRENALLPSVCPFFLWALFTILPGA